MTCPTCQGKAYIVINNGKQFRDLDICPTCAGEARLEYTQLVRRRTLDATPIVPFQNTAPCTPLSTDRRARRARSMAA